MAPSDFSTAGKGPGESDASAGRVKSSDVVLYSNDRLDLKQPYHVFDLKKKKQLVLIASLAGLFSPLSSNIYFPALDAIAKELHVVPSMVALTVTVYMIVQGLAPSFWGPLSDTLGRRPIFVATFVVYLLSNIGLAFAHSFVALMILRGVQAAGSAATISIGAGVIGDITTARERGGLIGTFGGIRMLGQSIGPVFGGVLTQYLGFRSIFWFLFIFGAIVLFLIILILPETLRSIAGNGSVPLRGLQRPLIYVFQGPPPFWSEATLPKSSSQKTISFTAMTTPIQFLFEKDVFVTLWVGSIVYAVWSMVTSSTASIFEERYQLSNILLGVAFIPNGLGCVLGSILTGSLMNRDYKKTEAEQLVLLQSAKLNGLTNFTKTSTSFPIERARLRSIWWMVLVFILATGLYGPSFRINIIYLPLLFQFLIAYTATAIFALNSALMIDLFPGAAASATAVNNLMRCSVGAVGVGVVQILIDKLGVEVTFLLLTAVTVGMTPLLAVEWIWGPRWRRAREEKLERERIEDEEL